MRTPLCFLMCLSCLLLTLGGCDRGTSPGATAEVSTEPPMVQDSSDQAQAPAEQTGQPQQAEQDAVAGESADATGGASVLSGITMRGLDGQPVDLASYHGQVVMLVNVASRCGNTPQYAGLQKLHEQYADHGLVMVGVPSNDFGGQEPGTAEEIAEFCQANYGVTFTMLDKVEVKGDNKTELYRRLTDPANDPTDRGEVAWNFEKFLVSRSGEVVARFGSRVQPDSEEVLAAIQQALVTN